MISGIVTLLTTGISFFKERQAKIHDMQMAGIENRTRLLLDKNQINHEWEMKALESSSWNLKMLSFILFAGPVIITVLNPEYGAKIWASLEDVPSGFMQIYYSITGAIWGLASLKDAGVSLSSVSTSLLKKK